MGTWDTGIFDDDIAMDVKAEFDDAMAEDLTVEEATEQVLESFEDELEDEDDGPVVYFALAVLQMEQGSVTEDIRQAVLHIIETGQGLERWKDAEEEKFNKRIGILNELKQKLEK